jgi:hypothetical protein
MLARLPGWATSNDDSVRREVAEYRDMSPGDRAQGLMATCRTAAALLAARSDAADVLAFRDPVPESTLRALARLRTSARSR